MTRVIRSSHAVRTRIAPSLGVGLVLAVALLTSSCQWGRSPAKPRSGEGAAGDPASASEEFDRAQSQQMILNSLAILERRWDPRSIASALEQLDQAALDNEAAERPLPADVAPIVEQFLGSTASEYARRGLFSQQDAEYLQRCVFLRGVANRLPDSSALGATPEQEPRELRLARAALEWVDRYVSLLPDDLGPNSPPFAVIVRGSGSGLERMWVYLELLRQADIPACVVALPRDEKRTAFDPWLVGVMVGDETYLFDAKLGIPLPSPTTEGGVATLAHLGADPAAVLGPLREVEEADYRVHAEDVRGVALLLLLEPAMVAPRVAKLQEFCDTADGIKPNLTLDFQALRERATRGLAKLNDTAGVRLWTTPVEISLDTQPRQAVSDPRLVANPLWLQPGSARQMQLFGEHDEAIRELVKLDASLGAEELGALLLGEGSENMPLEQRRRLMAERRRLVPRVRQDILFYTALSKLEQPKPGPRVADDWLRRYLRTYGDAHLRTDDVLNWGSLVVQLISAGQADGPSPGHHIWSLLTEEERSHFERAGQSYQGVREVEATMAELRAQAEVLRAELGQSGALTEQSGGELRAEFDRVLVAMAELAERSQDDIRLEGALRKDMVSALNRILELPEFWDAESFERVRPLIAPASKLAACLDQPSGELSPQELLRRNRQLLGLAFPYEIAGSEQYWVYAAIRQRALSLKRQGKLDEALELLRTPHPDVSPTQQTALRAQAAVWGPPPSTSSEDAEPADAKPADAKPADAKPDDAKPDANGHEEPTP